MNFAGAIVAGVVFIVCLGLIFTERLNRTIAAIGGAALMVLVGRIFGFYDEHLAVEMIDYETLGLLLGMMVLVALLEPTGFFQYLAVRAGQLSKGYPWRLLVLLASVTTVLSMFLDNVTTVVLIAPVTILISEILGISSTPFLLAEALLSNTGGVATLVGDPPNVLIASAADFSFLDFITHTFPVVIVAWITVLIMLRLQFGKQLSVIPENAAAIQQLNPRESMDEPRTARKVLVILGIAILLFFIQHLLKVTPAFIALCAAAVALLWVRPDMKAMFQRIEWSVLIFFIALFVMVGGLEKAGILDSIVTALKAGIHLPPIVFGLIIIWVVAGLSSIVDNVPITIALIPVVLGLAEAGMNSVPLWWALAFGAGFGGNGTIIGSSANIIVTTLSEKTRHPITSKIWNKTGLPVLGVTCMVASIFYILLFPLFTR